MKIITSAVKKTILTFTAVVLVLTWVTSASAIRITHDDGAGNVSVLFFDNFEDDTAATVATDDADPAPVWDADTVGWNENSNGLTANVEEVQVLDSTVGSLQAYMPNSAAEGNNYLSFARDDSNGVVGARTGVELNQTYTTGKLRAEFMFWTPNQGVNPAEGDQEGFADAAFVGNLGNEWNTRLVLFRDQLPNSGEVGSHPDGSSTGVPITKGAWESWVVEADLDANTNTVTVNGVSSSAIANAHTGGANAFSFATQGGNAAYAIDSITLASPGDFNNDTEVDEFDFGILRDHMGAHIEGPVDFSMGDNNRDGRVDLQDFVEFKGLFPAVVAAAAASIPEPTSVALLTWALVSLALVARRSVHGAQ